MLMGCSREETDYICEFIFFLLYIEHIIIIAAVQDNIFFILQRKQLTGEWCVW
jgi:hypothetical protein